jgi:HK97 family phage portal protein
MHMELIGMEAASWASAREPRSLERRSAPTSWDLMKLGADHMADAGVHVSPHLAENLSTVFACVQAIAESVGMLPLLVYRKGPAGARMEDPAHPLALLFGGDPNPWQTGAEFIEMMTAHCLLRGNAYAEIVRDNRGVPVSLTPFHPDWVSLVRIRTTGRWAYDVSLPEGGTRRILPEDMLHLKDRSDDGIMGKSRLQRTRETFGVALASERYAASTFRNGAAMSGILSHPEHLGEEATKNLKASFKATYGGADKAGEVAVLEEGLKWQQISVSPDDAQMLETRRFSVEQLARIYRVPTPIIGHYEGGNYSSLAAVGQWFYQHTLMPWLNKWERTIEHAMLSTAGRRSYEVEFDVDTLLRGDMLTRFQAYRIAREIGVYNANELRRFEKQNPRTDEDAETYLAPSNMQPEQSGRPIGDRTPGGVPAE